MVRSGRRRVACRAASAFLPFGKRPHTRRARRMSERLLNAAEVAELLAVPESWVREHTRNGSLPRVQLGRYIRYRREAILVWLGSQEAAEAKPSRGTARSHTQPGLTRPRTATTT